MKVHNFSSEKLASSLFKEKVDLLRFLWIFSAVISLGLFGINNYFIFHSIVEMFGIILSVSVSLIAINTYDISKNKFFLLLGIVYIFSSFFAFFHVISVFQAFGTSIDSENILFQFHLAGMFFEVIGLLIAFGYFKKDINPTIFISGYLIVSIIVLLSICSWHVFPKMYISNFGFTKIKIVSEYIITALFSVIIIVLYKNRNNFSKGTSNILYAALICAVISELIFSINSGLFQWAYEAAHIFKIFYYYFIYMAVSETSLKKPYSAIFYELSNANEELRRENSEKEKMEAMLRESEEKYRFVTELCPDAIILHKDLIIIYANKSALSFLGASSMNEIKGKNILDFVKAKFKKIAADRIQHTKTTGETEHFIEEVFTRVDRSEVYAEAAVTSMPFDNDLMLSIIRDLSERKIAEKNMKLLNDTLNYDNLKTEFFANISHELRTPLNVIFGAVQLIEMYNSGDNRDQNTEKYTKIMRQNCYRLLRLVNNLIDITRIDSGFYTLHEQNLDIVSVVEDITMSVVQYAKNKSIDIIFDTDVEEKLMSFDPDKIERIILNLLSNAIKFTMPDGSIEVNVFDKGDSVIISVKDSGEGIPKDKLDVIFERFRQVDKSLARDHEGSGIGLSLVKALVNMHHGTISVKSKVNEGSEFIVELPARIIEEEIVRATGTAEGNIETINIEFSDIYS